MKEAFEFRAHVFWEFNRILNDKVDQSVDAVSVKWRGANKELVDDDTEGPQIHCVVVWELLDQFRCHVERGTLNGG